jgi:hypothetical protein
MGGSADVDFTEDHDLLAGKRQRHDLVGLVEPLGDHAGHAISWKGRPTEVSPYSSRNFA